MELDDMKEIWQQYSKLLQQNTILNEQLVNHILKDKSRNVISKLVNMEYVGIAICSIVLLFLAVNTSPAGNSTALSVCYFVSVFFVIAALALCFYKIRHLNTIDLNANAVTDVAEKMNRYRLIITIERTVSVALSPVFIFSLFAVMMLWVHEINIFEDISVFLPRLILGLALGIIAMLILYRKFYMQNIKNILDNLKEIEQFKKE